VTQLQAPTQLDPTLARQHLAQLLKDESTSLEHLEALLNREHQLLGGTDFDALERAGNERQGCMADLLRIEAERRSLCRMLGFADDLPGLQSLLEWCDPTRSLGKQWTVCMQMAVACRQANERNGALVTAKLKRVEGLLGMLTGRDRSTAVYGPQGSHTHQSARPPLAQA